MIEEETHTDENIPGTSLSAGSSLRDTRIIEKALRNKWPIPEQFREAVVNRQIAIAIDPKSKSREATSAARCLVSMEGQNQEILLRTLDKIVPDQVEVDHTHHTTDTRGEVAEMLNHGEYLEYLRTKAVAEDCDAGIVCAVHDGANGRAVANGASHERIGPGANGHRNGRE